MRFFNGWSPLLRSEILKPEGNWLERINSGNQDIVLPICGNLSNAISRYRQLQEVIERSLKICLMARRYPWHGTPITKTDHFHTVWFCFSGYCYLFEERAKRFYDDWNKARGYFDMKPVSQGQHIKKICSEFKPYLQHRGEFTHEYNKTHYSFATFELIEQLNLHTGEYAHRLNDSYLESKADVLWNIANGTLRMCSEFSALLGEPAIQIPAMAKALDTHINRVLMKG
ncbi:hypothetical protein [Hyphomonas sp.]|uniref:hypothetical protein n=1 Tax=Hyphomonas sp. TaxID=87 RepID=UPI0025C0114D|nr:hypothetical protein [Hyphomonas sp.]